MFSILLISALIWLGVGILTLVGVLYAFNAKLNTSWMGNLVCVLLWPVVWFAFSYWDE